MLQARHDNRVQLYIYILHFRNTAELLEKDNAKLMRNKKQNKKNEKKINQSMGWKHSQLPPTNENQIELL
jgi:hypothetical protein